ncbi:LysR substrate-binding domain-containing protein [Pseudoroseomonas cervicalis]|uniref:LysR substrate-binding domain-containing protein n=1 Tax=Teichococcus cervicalis TaxID=204525 RepID=UPI00278A8D72|nr:LysR substrate-binding domain-containing protein [Pseudoroseomonas cervicalis]MDQ1081936.1 DNA-binding transcriptional LysR family regulator [Pseudoroseomonas cervicalis]
MQPPAPKRLPPNWFARARLKLRHLQLLQALDETRNLHRAAALLGLTQPAASKLLAEVETMLGGALFERHARGMRPNEWGEVMLRRARSALVELEQAAAELNGLREGSGGVVAFGTVTAAAADAVVRAVEAVQREHPALQVTVEVDTSPPLVARLREGRLDFIVARPPAEPVAGLDYREIGEEELCFMAAQGHPLLARGPVGLAEMLDYGWVLQPPGSLLRQEVEEMFLRHRLPFPRRVLSTASMLLSLAALSQGQSIGVFSASVVGLFAERGKLQRLAPPREQPRLTVRPFGLIRSRDRPLSPSALRLYEAVARELDSAAAPVPG